MISETFKAILCAVLVCVAGAASSQESESDAVSKADDSDAAPGALERCFNVAGFTDMSVISDHNLYIRTRAQNHYLVTTEQCKNLQRSYRRGTARIVPYGHTVCGNDGSYLVYDAGSREQTCQILIVERVQDRAEAKALAAGKRPLVEIEEITPAD